MRLAFLFQTCGPSLPDRRAQELPRSPQEPRALRAGLGDTRKQFHKKTHSAVLLSYVPSALGQSKTAKLCSSHKYQ